MIYSRLATKLYLLLCLYSSFAYSNETNPAIDSKKTLTLYHDADWSNSLESAQSIWRGVNTALSEVDYMVQDYHIRLIKKDHSGNVLLSLNNMKDFIADEQALAIISGVHSPPLIKHRTFINENKILTLVPWAAGGPITRYPSKENWVFRLSVDDTKAGDTLVEYALTQKKCSSPHLFLENTQWGESNSTNMSQALKQSGIESFQVTTFNWGIKKYIATSKLRTIINQGATCVVLVANAMEGSVVVKAMSELPEEKRIPIISHWGITSGGFNERVSQDTLKKIDLSFIQTCFSFFKEPFSKKGASVFNQAKTLYKNEIKTAHDIDAPTGFIHGYDLTQLLLQALSQVNLVSDIELNRATVRKALENINTPVEGLIKRYKKPFSVFSKNKPDAHEALSKDDYCMAKFDTNNKIHILQNNTPL